MPAVSLGRNGGLSGNECEDAMNEQSTRFFPVIYSFEGNPSDDSSAFLVEGTGFDGSIVRFAIPLDNIQHFVAFLLVWAGTISAGHPNRERDDSQNHGRIPIPATSIAIGQPRQRGLYRTVRRVCRTCLFLARVRPCAGRANVDAG
jgi:hypothetical protein